MGALRSVIPLIVIVVCVIGFLATNYLSQQSEFSSIKAQLTESKNSVTEVNSTVVGLKQSLTQSSLTIAQLSRDLDAAQNKLADWEKIHIKRIEEQSQLTVSLQETLDRFQRNTAEQLKTMAKLDADLQKQMTEMTELSAERAADLNRTKEDLASLRKLVDSQVVTINYIQEKLAHVPKPDVPSTGLSATNQTSSAPLIGPVLP